MIAGRRHARGLPAGGWRWTGDRAILRENGTVRIAGRSKDIIMTASGKVQKFRLRAKIAERLEAEAG